MELIYILTISTSLLIGGFSLIIIAFFNKTNKDLKNYDR